MTDILDRYFKEVNKKISSEVVKTEYINLWFKIQIDVAHIWENISNATASATVVRKDGP